MRPSALTICLALLAAAVAASPSDATKKVSIDRQLTLKRTLVMQVDRESLLTTIRGNLDKWENLTPEQRSRIRSEAWASLRDASEAEQTELLQSLRQFQRLSAAQQEQYRRRAAWLRELMTHLTDRQKAALLAMPPMERAQELLRLSRQLQAEGKMPADTQPAK